MATITEVGLESAQALIQQEIEKAQKDLRPVSRQSLARTLSHERGLAFADALQVVDDYCDDKAPFTPDYLSKEFMLPYLKVLSLVIVGASLLIIAYATKLQLSHQTSWLWYVIGAVLFVFSGLGLLQILRTERE